MPNSVATVIVFPYHWSGPTIVQIFTWNGFREYYMNMDMAVCLFVWILWEKKIVSFVYREIRADQNDGILNTSRFEPHLMDTPLAFQYLRQRYQKESKRAGISMGSLVIIKETHQMQKQIMHAVVAIEKYYRKWIDIFSFGSLMLYAYRMMLSSWSSNSVYQTNINNDGFWANMLMRAMDFQQLYFSVSIYLFFFIFSSFENSMIMM